MAQALDSRYTAHTSGRLLDLGSGGVPWKDHLLELEQEQGISGDQALLYVIYTDQVPSLHCAIVNIAQTRTLLTVLCRTHFCTALHCAAERDVEATVRAGAARVV